MGIYARHDSKWHRVDEGGSTSVGTQWGDFTTNGDASEENTWTAPDSQGRIWKYAVYDVAGDYTINLTGGMYWVLCVGGGDGGYGSGNSQQQQGQQGLVNEGFWDFPKNSATPITVGKKGAFGQTELGMPSSIGEYGTQGLISWGQENTGRGSSFANDNTGYKSRITGHELQYATGRTGLDRPGRSGAMSSQSQRDGCVIIATVDEEKTDYYPPGALPGLGGWATITDVKGKGNKYSYTDADGDWVAYEWTADGSLTTQAGGLVDALVVGGGGGGGSGFVNNSGDHVYACGQGGEVREGLRTLAQGPIDISVGVGGAAGFTGGGDSSLGEVVGEGGWQSRSGSGIESSILNGVPKTYGKRFGPTENNTGSGGGNDAKGWSGVVIVRVPKANYTGNLPDGAFDIPTTRQAVVSALEEKVEEAKEAVRDRRKRR